MIISLENFDAIREQYDRLLWHVAHKYARKRLGRAFGTAEDIHHEAVLALRAAVATFDPGKGFTFLTYAWRVLHNEVRKAVLFRGPLIRVPGHALPHGDGSKYAGRADKIEQYRAAGRKALAVGQVPVGDEGETMELADRRERPEPAYAPEEVAALRDALRRLSELDRFVLESRFGIGLRPEQSLDDVGAQLCVTKERIRQIEEQALDNLKRELLRHKGVRAWTTERP